MAFPLPPVHAWIADNLRHACPDATDDELVAVATAAHLHGSSARCPTATTIVGERGHRLPSGEKQRVAIARMAPPYTARAMEESDCLFLSAAAFERLLAERPAIARRWLSSVAARLAASQARLLGLLGGSLAEQAARLLLDEATDGLVPLPQRTLAAMLGVQRPSLNKLLRDFERRGLIELGYRSVRILDPNGLERLAGGRRG